jgi:hypothetical protein
MKATLTPPTTTDELLQRYDEDFVRHAYLLLLGRAADPAGLDNYVRQVRAGVPKERMVVAMTVSDEGRNHGADLPGLKELVRGYRLDGQSRVSRWARRLLGGALEATEMQLRAIDNRLYLSARDNELAFARLSAELSQVLSGPEGRVGVIQRHADLGSQAVDAPALSLPPERALGASARALYGRLTSHDANS